MDSAQCYDFFPLFSVTVWNGERLVKDSPQWRWIWRTGALQGCGKVAVGEHGLWGQLGLWDGELGDHIRGRFVATYVLEQKGYSGWCT